MKIKHKVEHAATGTPTKRPRLVIVAWVERCEVCRARDVRCFHCLRFVDRRKAAA